MTTGKINVEKSKWEQSLQSKDSHCLKKNFPKRGGDGTSPSFALAPTVRVTISTLPNLPLS